MQSTARSKLMMSACFVVLASGAFAAPLKKPQREAQKVTPPAEMLTPAPTAQGITYALKDIIKAKASEFCAGYGAESGCIEEIEICISIVDSDDDPVRLCVNTAPDQKPIQSARAKKASAR